MYTSIIILIGIIILLMGYIKFHIDLQYFPDERKWYEKIRFILPLLLLPIFSLIYVYWDQYPNRLIEKDSTIEAIKTQSNNTIVWPYEIPTTHSVAPNVDEDTKTKLQEIGEKYGTYGDTYGSLNTLFTGFAFAGLIISIFIQLLELRQTRKELSGQKSEFQKQTKILANQQKLIDEQFEESKKQNFINQFYALLEQRNNLLNNLVLHDKEKELYGHQIISKYAQKFREIREGLKEENNNEVYFEEQWGEFNFKIFGYYDYQVKNYLRIYGIIFYTIQNSNFLNSNEKLYYKNIIKALIGVDEKIILIWLGIFSNRINLMCSNNSIFEEIYHPTLKPIIPKYYSIEAVGNSSKWRDIFTETETPTT